MVYYLAVSGPGLRLGGVMTTKLVRGDLEQFSRSVAAATSLPVLLYNLPQFTSGGRSSTSLGNAPFGDWRCWTKAIDHALREAAIEVVQFSFNEAAHLSRLTHCAEIEQ
jgi:hypothetical protein